MNIDNKSKMGIELPRIVNYLIGMLLTSFGMTVMLKLRLGMSPTSSLPVTIFEALQVFTVGRWITIVQILFVIVIIIITKKISLSIGLSFLSIVAMGLLVDFFEYLLSDLLIENIVIRLIVLLASCVLISTGIVFMLLCEYPTVPDLYMMNEIEKKYDIPVAKSKLAIDVSFVLIASVISYFVLKSFVHVGIGTIIAAMLNGTMVGWIKPVVNKYVSNSYSKVFDKVKSISEYNVLHHIIKAKQY